MDDNRDAGNSRDTGNSGRGQDNGANGAGSSLALSPEQELVYRLKAAIDSRGRYSFRLQDMVAGFAAGQGISAAAARRSIEDKFTNHVGLSPQDYLDRHYEERRQNSRGSMREQGEERGNGYGRGR